MEHWYENTSDPILMKRMLLQHHAEIDENDKVTFHQASDKDIEAAYYAIQTSLELTQEDVEDRIRLMLENPDTEYASGYLDAINDIESLFNTDLKV